MIRIQKPHIIWAFVSACLSWSCTPQSVESDGNMITSFTRYLRGLDEVARWPEVSYMQASDHDNETTAL